MHLHFHKIFLKFSIFILKKIRVGNSGILNFKKSLLVDKKVNVGKFGLLIVFIISTSTNDDGSKPQNSIIALSNKDKSAH